MTADNSLFVGQLVVGNDGGRQGFLKKLQFNHIADSWTRDILVIQRY